jgi:hypothetical protein
MTYAYIFKCFLCVLLSSLKVSDLTFGSLTHFELIFVRVRDRDLVSFSLLHVDVQFSQHHLLKRLPFLQCMCLASLSKIRWLQLCGFTSGSSILFHWFLCPFVCAPAPCCFCYCGSVVYFEVKYCETSSIALSLRIDCYLGFLMFRNEF